MGDSRGCANTTEKISVKERTRSGAAAPEDLKQIYGDLDDADGNASDADGDNAAGPGAAAAAAAAPPRRLEGVESDSEDEDAAKGAPKSQPSAAAPRS